ncbi:Ribonucleases P/MRP protein subunit POP1 [Leucoagaricus sp. SymC.cos]|nr:Ribonucleases P/MRP protein subunit POP1 [Leucoagaricus sp. SymC.cos]
MSSSQGAKRKPGADEMTGREKKKQKMNQARTIPVQPSVARESGNGVVNSMRGLPSAIDVEKFAEARAFEIDAMEKAMETASGASTQRAWQVLPRHLRRRAASHDVRRVPGRLRKKAKAEMDPTRKKLVSRKLPKAGRNKITTKTDSFLKRQRDKTWLETHIWHAKRMKMENMWGYRLVLHPTEKCFRPSHRASVQGSILHDASYFATLEMKGPQLVLVAILEFVCDVQSPSPGAIRFVLGSRVLNTHLYGCGAYPFGLLGPATVMWRPIITQTKTDTNRPRTLWLRIHPLIFNDVTRELQKATSDILARPRSSTEEIEVEITDLRGQVNAFEIMGPKSSQVLKGALTAASSGDERADFTKFWSSLSAVQTPGSIPRNTVIGFTAIDPRLNFPSKNAPIKYKEETPQIFPSTELARSDLWEQDVRKTLSKPRFKKKDLDERRSKSLVPGTALTPTRQDNRIPLLLIRRTIDTPGAESQAIHGYTLFLPAGWSMPFWSSLTYTGTRVGGQRERQTQAFEAGTAYFPRDFPFSSAHEEWAAERENSERDTWLRKPPAKRVNYGKLGVKSPWRADWDVILGQKEAQRDDPMDVGEDGTQAQDVDVDDHDIPDASMRMDVDEPDVKPWLLRGLEITRIIAGLGSNPGPSLMTEVDTLRQKRSLPPLGSAINSVELLKCALVNVKVIMFKEGVPEDLAMIYRVSDEEVTKWEHLMAGKASSVSLLQLANKRPSQEDIIGYVTTGHYSLSRGEGFALGAIPLTRFLELQDQQRRLYPNQTVDRLTLFVKVRNINGQQCRAAHLKILECGN